MLLHFPFGGDIHTWHGVAPGVGDGADALSAVRTACNHQQSPHRHEATPQMSSSQPWRPLRLCTEHARRLGAAILLLLRAGAAPQSCSALPSSYFSNSKAASAVKGSGDTYMSPTLNVTSPPHLQHEGSKVEGSMCWIADPAFPRCCRAACHLLGACQACGGCSPLPSGGRRGAADPPRAPPAAPRPHGHMEVGGAGGLLVS